jgi:endonuclease/exonuclease/phosphatase family metal-dependent hydrolase
VRTHCGNEPQADLAACAVQNCRHLAGQLLGSCLGCLSRDPLRDVDTILNECGYDAARAGAGDADGYFYGGSYGIGLLTNAKVLAQSFLRVRSTQHPRGIIHVELDTPVADGLHVFCTHLTPELGNLARPKLGSWREEQAEQVRAMLAFIEAETEPGDAVVVMGDLNTGPAIGSGVGARLAGHYERFIGAGFTNPYTSEPHASCTFCYDNPVSGGGVGGSLLDHVLIRDMPGIVSARRILDAPIHVESHGRDVETALSDHYGLLLVVQRD